MASGVGLGQPEKRRTAPRPFGWLRRTAGWRRRSPWRVDPLLPKRGPLPWHTPRKEAPPADPLSWSILTGRPPSEVSFILELAERLDDLSDIAPVYGLGYTWIEGWRPLIMVDAAAAPPAQVTYMPQPWQLLDWWQPTGALRELPDLTVLATGRPLPTFGPDKGKLIRRRGSPKQGTVGPRVVLQRDGDSYPGFLTAGHMFATGQGTIVELPPDRFARRMWRKLWKRPDDRVGVVVHHESPFSHDSVEGPAYDFAVVELDGIAKAKWRDDEFVPSLGPAQAYEEEQPVRVFAGVSGDVDQASLMGACMRMNHWRDCWMIGPASAICPGDSGATVVKSKTEETIGMVVGQSYFDKALGAEVHHTFVQSLGRLMEERLAGKDILIERHGRRSK